MDKEKTYTKTAKGQECSVYELFSELAEKYNKKFKVLELPRAIKINKQTCQIVLPYYDGKKYDDVWNEGNGGSPMGLELSEEVPVVLCDLTKIKIKPILADKRINKIQNFKFDFKEWQKRFDQEVKKFRASSVLSNEEIKRAKKILDSRFRSRFIFSNGDFYPRNFIKQDRKIVLIDWQTWDKDFRVSLIDYWENIFAFCFIHMWGNKPWQINYLKELRKYFRLKAKNFQKALLIKSFDQANLWFEDKNLRSIQIEILKKALDKKYVKDLLKSTRPNIVHSLLRSIKRLK